METACRWLGTPLGEGRYRCASPKLAPGSVTDELQCLRCYARDHAPVVETPVRPCRFRGAVVRPAASGCGSCARYACTCPGRATEATLVDCFACADREEPAALEPEWVRPLGLPGWFNAGLVDHGGKRWLAFRQGWAGARLGLAEVRPDWTVADARLLDFPRLAQHQAGKEDPRPFVHQGRLHLAYIGVQVAAGRTTAHMCFARLGEDLRVEECWCPHYPRRRPWEKNWAPFSCDGELYAVYQAQPHRVLRLTEDRAEDVAEEQTDWPWTYGEARGGAAPVRVGDEYWSFFHGTKERRGQGRHRSYGLGLYTFDARPPFRPRRLIPRPLLLPVDAQHTTGGWCAVVFPCGAVREGNSWLVSYGYNDAEVRVACYDHVKLEGALVPL